MFVDESAGLRRHKLGLIPVRRVSAFRNHEQAGFRERCTAFVTTNGAPLA
jgi:hypothetical protein